VNVDGLLAALGDEASSAVAGLLRRAYEIGYREALAAAGHPAGDTGAVTAPQPVVYPEGDEADPGEDVETDDDDTGNDEPSEEERRRAPNEMWPILARTSVGTLKRRIVQTFALERFDIDIVICRRGDASRRQLKTNVRLSKYFAKEGRG
jgi:hypothetical protein